MMPPYSSSQPHAQDQSRIFLPSPIRCLSPPRALASSRRNLERVYELHVGPDHLEERLVLGMDEVCL